MGCPYAYRTPDRIEAKTVLRSLFIQQAKTVFLLFGTKARL